MTSSACPFEERLLDAERSGFATPELAAHADGCATCAAALVAERALRALAEAPAGHRLPTAEIVLLRARIRARREAAERSLRPLVVWQRLVATVAVAGLVVGAAIGGPALAGLGAVEAPTPARLLAGAGLLGLAALVARACGRIGAGDLSAG